MERLYEVLAHKGIRTAEQVSHLIMDRLTIKEILDLNAHLLDAVPGTQANIASLAQFDFIADSDMTAQHGSCLEWNCRLRRMMQTARFASLYCDTLYIPNYLEHYPQAPKGNAPGLHEENHLRYMYAGDIKLLLALKPLADVGIVRLIKTKYHFCKDCAERIIPRSTVDGVNAAVRRLNERYLRQCKARLVRGEQDLGPLSPCLRVQGPGDLYEGGSMVRLSPALPQWLLRKSGLATAHSRKRVYDLGKSDLRRMKIPLERLERVASDVVFQHMLSRLMNTKYLTHREIDGVLVSAFNTHPGLSRCNDILSSELICELPFLENIGLKEILKVRRHEHDAFLVFRNTLSRIISDQLQHPDKLTRKDAKAIYLDLLYPDLCKLNAHARTLRRSKLADAARDILVTSGLLSLGLFTGLFPHDAKLFCTALGGFQISRELLKALISTITPPDSIRNHNLFFLWKLTRKRLPP